MRRGIALIVGLIFLCTTLYSLVIPVRAESTVATQKYVWKNVKIEGGGGFITGIVFNPKEKKLGLCKNRYWRCLQKYRWWQYVDTAYELG